MKIGIVGGGYAGIISAILIKKKNPNYEVFLYEGNTQLGKKLSMTGSGRCNLGNRIVDDHSYNVSEAYEILENCPLPKQIEILNSLGILTTDVGRYVYPHSLSAKAYVSALERILERLGVCVRLNSKLMGYRHEKEYVDLFFYDGHISHVDRLVITCGGSTFAKTGSDGSVFSILKEHNYSITPLRQGLGAVMTLEDTKTILHERLKCVVSLKEGSKVYYKEEGEIIFKKDGISGICAFNSQSVIERFRLKKPVLSFDIIPDYSEEQLLSFLKKNESVIQSDFLKGLFTAPVSNYLRKRLDSIDNVSIIKLLKNFEFTYSGLYDFDDAIVTIGGVKLSDLSGLQSKTERNVYFAGEVLDIDGLCGGYSLMMAFAGAYKVSEDI